VATVQALAILSSHEAASNRDARGWLYSGEILLIKMKFKKKAHNKARHVNATCV
jgi:hypothetical protein